MSALRDPKRGEIRASAIRHNRAAGMRSGAAADLAAEVAGYEGASRATNARKRAQRADVKRRMAELAEPAQVRAIEQVNATVEWAIKRLTDIAGPDLGIDAIKTTDQLRAIELLAKINGWMAPDKQDVTVRDASQVTDDDIVRLIAFEPAERIAETPVDPS